MKNSSCSERSSSCEKVEVEVHNSEEIEYQVVDRKDIKLDTKNSKISPWRPKDDERLQYYCMKYPENWAKISTFFKHQDKDACKKRYLYLKANKGGKWSAEETRLLLNLY